MEMVNDWFVGLNVYYDYYGYVMRTDFPPSAADDCDSQTSSATSTKKPGKPTAFKISPVK